jgi:hypothetical protein
MSSLCNKVIKQNGFFFCTVRARQEAETVVALTCEQRGEADDECSQWLNNTPMIQNAENGQSKERPTIMCCEVHKGNVLKHAQFINSATL